MAALHLPQATVDAVLADWKTAPVPDRTRAALRLLEAMTLRPREIDPALVRSLQATGIDETALRGVANSGFHDNLINRVADAFDFERPEGAARERLAHALDLASRLVKGPAARVPFVVGADGVRRPEEVEAGLTTPDLRRGRWLRRAAMGRDARRRGARG